MLIRILHAKVRPGRQAEFKKTLEMISLPAFQSRSGMVALYPGLPQGRRGTDFVLVTVWKDLETLESRSEEEWAKAILPAEALPLLESWSIQGYRSFGVGEPGIKPLFLSI